MKQKNGTEIFELVIKMQGQLNELDKKIDALMMRSLVGGTPKQDSFQKPAFQKSAFQKPIHTQMQVNQVHRDQQKSKEMHTIICAECKKESSIPFKPTGDRPVYCKECFSRRKTWVSHKTENNYKPQEAVPAVQPASEVISAPAAKAKKKPAAAKKPVAKKKVIAKKKKK